CVDPARGAVYAKGLDIAFSEVSQVLVEVFVAGTEYRLFILDGKCEAVLLPLPANFVGDGSSNIPELVEKKKQDQMRGR
ncbi:bifunctional glutamate--cysteine ligase/glutathione synthetase, partial [Streptococcus suis]